MEEKAIQENRNRLSSVTNSMDAKVLAANFILAIVLFVFVIKRMNGFQF